MSMLAGPRRKQKVINLRAKNNSWSNDANKFGQKMLEKMGWSEGKGLGAKENGIVEHVIAKYKNDDCGLGYEDRSDQWTKHEDEFNSLLSNLSNGDSSQGEKVTYASLEEKSKSSKARVHYSKFTRGKDISRYSEKDLANIFGKKCLKDKPKQEGKKENGDSQSSEQIFKDAGSMEEYFKIKFSKKDQVNTVERTKEEEPSEFCFVGFSNIEDTENTDNLQPHSTTKKKKKLKTCTVDDINLENNFPENCLKEDEGDCPSQTQDIKKKKRKKNKHVDYVLEEEEGSVSNGSVSSKKNKIDSPNSFLEPASKHKKKKHKSKSSL